MIKYFHLKNLFTDQNAQHTSYWSVSKFLQVELVWSETQLANKGIDEGKPENPIDSSNIPYLDVLSRKFMGLHQNSFLLLRFYRHHLPCVVTNLITVCW